jgi:methyltransferase (TIGR00027 family)
MCFLLHRRVNVARRDNDSWDLASSVGATATGVAASRALASQGPDPLINDPFAEPLVRAVGVEAFTRLITGELAVAEDDTGNDPAVTRQQMAEQMAVRTRFFDDFFAGAGAEGVRQAVILASGLDTRAYRLLWPAGTVVYEIDQPQVIEFKTTTLQNLGASPTTQHRVVGIDLRDDWPTALRHSGFDPSRPTAWSAEGLLVYLPAQAQDRLFDHITKLSASGSRVATEHIPDMSVFSDDRSRLLSKRWRQFGVDVDMTDLVYHGERSSVIEYLGARGWRTTTYPATELYATNGFTLPDDELMTHFADFSYLTAVLMGGPLAVQ